MVKLWLSVVAAMMIGLPAWSASNDMPDQNLNLSGVWSYVADPDGSIKESSVRERLSQGSLKQMPVPSNWSRRDPDLLNYSGVVWFARTFSVDSKLSGKDRWLAAFDGVDYEASVFLNDKPVGTHVGYFEPFRLDVTDTIQSGENVLVVRVNSPRDAGYADNKTLVKGILVQHDCRPGSRPGQDDQNEPTGGIWGGVHLVRTGPVTIENVRIRTDMIGRSARVTLRYSLRNRSAASQKASLRVSVRGKTFESEPVDASSAVSLTAGALAEQVLTVDLPDPKLWWTWDHGRPDLYAASSEISTGGHPSESLESAFGVRTIEFDTQTLFMKLNGRRIFHRGSNYIPTQWLSTYDRAAFQRDIDLMKGANLNSIRVHAHVLPHTFYDLADSVGILVWADFALIWSYDTGEPFAREALRQYRLFIEGWTNHPSIWLWCAHNEGSANDPLNIRLEALGRTVDPTRVHLKNSGKWPPGPGGWDEHEYWGWYTGNYLEFADKKQQFLTEYGAQAVTQSAHEFLANPSQWPPDINDWKYHDFQPGENIRNVGPLELFRNLDEFIGVSQKYQYDVVRFATESYRRTKYSPLGGLYHFMFTECWPAITWAVVDHHRTPKLGYDALRDAMAPVAISMEIRKREVSIREKISVPVWVVSDLDHPIQKWTVRFGVVGQAAQTSPVTIAADSVAKVASFDVSAPDAPGASVRIFAELVDDQNRTVSSTEWEFLVRDDPYQLGNWTFRTGDDMAWAAGEKLPDGFKPIRVPGNWENDGYPDYDGYAWYRATFVVPKSHKGNLRLSLGPVDDVDELYVNGHFAGRTGTFPPQYQTAWQADRNYDIPKKLLRHDGVNVIAIRVYDSIGGGGPYRGPVRMGQPQAAGWIDPNLRYRPVRRDYP